MAGDDPIQIFLDLFERAKKLEASDPTACSLATADASGRPAVRMVLLKGIDERGFVFYTNYESSKVMDLNQNSRAALCFYWPTIKEQVRVEGRVERLSDEDSDSYFATRTRGSQIGAWASQQSHPLESRRILVGRFLKYQAKFAARKVPRPPFWGGFLVRPERIEFWHSQLDRLHDRLSYLRDGEKWTVQRLFP